MVPYSDRCGCIFRDALADGVRRSADGRPIRMDAKTAAVNIYDESADQYVQEMRTDVPVAVSFKRMSVMQVERYHILDLRKFAQIRHAFSR